MRLNPLLLLGVLASLGSSSMALGAEPAWDLVPTKNTSTLNLRGFGTLGIARSSSDQVEVVRDLSQPRGISNQWSGRIDSVLGVQANWQLTPEVELVSQVVSRYQYDDSRTRKSCGPLPNGSPIRA